MCREGAIRDVAAVYQRHEFLPERERALHAWARHVLAVAESPAAVTRGGNVIAPGRRRD
jgi:hypothetical protein